MCKNDNLFSFDDNPFETAGNLAQGRSAIVSATRTNLSTK